MHGPLTSDFVSAAILALDAVVIARTENSHACHRNGSSDIRRPMAVDGYTIGTNKTLLCARSAAATNGEKCSNDGTAWNAWWKTLLQEYGTPMPRLRRSHLASCTWSAGCAERTVVSR